MTHPFKAPAALLDELGIEEPSEIMIEAIAQHCGATVVFEPLEGCQGRILGVGDRAIITVDSTAHLTRQRFSAAHELGHWMRDRGKVGFSCSEANFVRDWEAGNPERNANRYAADLLLPARMFKPAARGVAPTFENVSKLAKVFSTSRTATAIRLAELGDSPAMLVCCDMRKRLWFFRGGTVPSDFWPLKRPGDGSVAHRLFCDPGIGTPGPTIVDADEWIDRPDASRYTVLEDSVRAGTDVVLTLLWWQDEAQIVDADPDNEAAVEMTGELGFSKRVRR